MVRSERLVMAVLSPSMLGVGGGGFGGLGVGGWRRWDDVRGVVYWEERSVEYFSR